MEKTDSTTPHAGQNWREIALAFIKCWEDCKLKAYPDPATGAAPWTIGYGSTVSGIGPGTVWTQAQADAALSERVQQINETVTCAIRVRIRPCQRAALISFCYNLGINAFLGSTLLRLLNKGDFAGAAAQFARWNHAAGKVMPGLTRRRAAEAELFMEGVS